MAKKPRKLTLQEAAIADFSKYSISSSATFHPDQWSNGREPADMIVKVGRAIIFVNMTAGRSYFEQLCDHNIQQARDRMLEWIGGRAIRGKNEWASFEIGWDEIDHIHVVSVVDGPHAACVNHPLDNLQMAPKVRLVTTLTSEVMGTLAQLRGGARDLIGISLEIAKTGKISGEQASRMVRARHDAFLAEATISVVRGPTRLSRPIIDGEVISAIDEYRNHFEAMRRENSDTGAIFADLSWHEIFAAVAYVLSTLEQIEWLDQGFVCSARFDMGVPFTVVVATSTEGLKIVWPKFLCDIENKSVKFIYCLIFFELVPAPIIAIGNFVGGFATERDLEKIPSLSSI